MDFKGPFVFFQFHHADWVVVLFVIGLLVDVIRDLYQQGRVRFFSNRYNCIAVMIVTFFVLHYIIWWAGRVALTHSVNSLEDFANQRSYRIMLLSECFLAVAVLLAFVQNFSFIQANSSTGPLLHAFTQMLMDVGKFFLYFAFIFLAFAVSFTKLYMQYWTAKQYFILKRAPHTNNTDTREPVR